MKLVWSVGHHDLILLSGKNDQRQEMERDATQHPVPKSRVELEGTVGIALFSPQLSGVQAIGTQQPP